MNVSIAGHTLKKAFNRRTIFENISFSLEQHSTLLITGANGSGKSTLVKIISGVLTPSQGEVSIVVDGKDATPALHALVGLVSPYLQMYEEFSPRENLQFALSVRGMKQRFQRIQPLLEEMQLGGRVDDPVRTFSSGMKQRVKYAFALIHQPVILILDEPMANLDSNGVDLVRHIMDTQKKNGILLVATNDTTDMNDYDSRVDLAKRD